MTICVVLSKYSNILVELEVKLIDRVSVVGTPIADIMDYHL